MPTVVIIDNLSKNRSMLMSLIRSDFKDKNDRMIEQSIRILGTREVENMNNIKAIYEQEKTVFLLLGQKQHKCVNIYREVVQ